MCRRCDNSPHEAFVSSSIPSHLQCGHHITRYRGTNFENTTYQSASDRVYDFNTADKMNSLLVNALLATGQLKAGQEYDFDFEHQFIETEKVLIVADLRLI